MRRQSVDFKVDNEVEQINTDEKNLEGLEQKMSEPMLSQDPKADQNQDKKKVDEPPIMVEAEKVDANVNNAKADGDKTEVKEAPVEQVQSAPVEQVQPLSSDPVEDPKTASEPAQEEKPVPHSPTSTKKVEEFKDIEEPEAK